MAPQKGLVPSKTFKNRLPGSDFLEVPPVDWEAVSGRVKGFVGGAEDPRLRVVGLVLRR